MADTLEEALRLASNEETVSPIVIRNDLRTITLPANFVIGVYNDKDVHSIPVEMPRYFKGLDLSEFSIRVNFVGPSGVKDRYLVTDANVEEDKITFHWLVGRNAFLKEGYSTTASGMDSHAEGNQTTASGDRSHAEGGNTTASNEYSHAEGFNTEASGQCSHAEGNSTKAIGNYSHAEGDSTTASGSASHAEGKGTSASSYSHAEGGSTKASGWYSHAEGSSAAASGSASHAEGNGTTASGSYSHAEGIFTASASDYQHVQGKYNVEDKNDVYAFIIGNGTSDARSNAFAIKWDGTIVVWNNGTAVELTPAKLAALIAG